jgi:hypothetical protein
MKLSLVRPELILLLFLVGCSAPSGRLTFPTHAIEQSNRGWFFDIHHRGRADFALLPDSKGRLQTLAYDDAGDWHFNRLYHLHDYANADVPHLIIMLDSIPFESIAASYRRGQFPWMDAPVKVIGPFPSLTEICYSSFLHAPPLPGAVDNYYDRDAKGSADTMWERLLHSYKEPWERRLDYTMSMYQSGLAYLHPREWYDAELQLAKQTFDDSPNRVTLVYFASASSMLSKYGQTGLDEVLAGVQRLCLQVLYERQGAVKITMLADHGHNLMASTNVTLDPWLNAAGFHVNDRLDQPNDVVLELQGLVTYLGVRTNQPGKVSAALCTCPQVDFAAYLEGDRVIVRNAQGSAAIDCREHKLRYVPIDADVLRYAKLLEQLRTAGKVDADGYLSDADWFAATLDAAYPDGARRLWDGFHGTVSHPPEVMLTMKDGWCAGRPAFEKFIKMASTHGSLNQVNTATFVMTMTGRTDGPMRMRDVLEKIEPGFTVPVH